MLHYEARAAMQGFTSIRAIGIVENACKSARPRMAWRSDIQVRQPTMWWNARSVGRA